MRCRIANAAALAVLLFVVVLQPAGARITPAGYRALGVEAPVGAAVPRDAIVADESGRSRNFGELISKPSVLVFADYTCRTLCGPILAFVSSALEQSHLSPDQFQLLVVGLDAKDTASDATRMRRLHLGAENPINAATTFVTTDDATVQRLTAALGYRYAYDRDTDEFIHPGAAYVLASDGRVTRVLTGLGISAADLKLALVEAGEGRVGTLGDRVRLLCSSFDPVHGMYNLLISRLLAATAIATIFIVGCGIALLSLMGRRGAA